MGWMDTLTTGLKGLGAVASIANDFGVPFAGMVSKVCDHGQSLLGLVNGGGGGGGGGRSLSGVKALAGGGANYAAANNAATLEMKKALEGSFDNLKTEVRDANAATQESLSEMKETQQEIWEKVGEVKEVLTSGFVTMCNQFEEMKTDLDKIQNLAGKTFEMIQEMHFLDGIENIDFAHAVFFKKNSNLDENIASFRSHQFELEKQYMQHMNPRKIARFFKMLADNEEDGSDRAMAMYNYVVTVEAKYLQMMCVNHIHRQDIEALSSQYELFISHYHQLTEAMSLVLNLAEVSDLEQGDYVYHGLTKVMRLVVQKKADELKAMSMFFTAEALAQSSCIRRRKSESGGFVAHISAAWLASEAGDTVSLGVFAKFEGVDLNKMAVTEAGVHLSSLQVAAEQGHLNAVKALLALQPCVNSGKNSLLEPCRAGKVELVRALLEGGEEPNMPGANLETPLLLAIEGGHEEIASILRDYKASDASLQVFRSELLQLQEKELEVEKKKIEQEREIEEKRTEPKIVSYGPFGASGGATWSDVNCYQRGGIVTGVNIAAGMWCDSIQAEYGGEGGEKHGGNGGNKNRVRLANGVYIVAVQGSSGLVNGQHVISEIAFTDSNGNRFGPYGKNMGGSTWKCGPPGGKLAYISGQAGNSLNQLILFWEDQ